MNVQEHLLACFAEEAVEVAHLCSKSLRFGLDDRNVENPAGPTNRQRLIAEINDFAAVLQLLETQKIISHDWSSIGDQARKKEKVRKFMEYAEKAGALNP